MTELLRHKILLTSCLSLLCATLWANHSSERQDVVVSDSTGPLAPPRLEALPPAADSLPSRKPNIFKRIYNFADHVLSPERDSLYIDVQDYNWCAETQLTTTFQSFEIGTYDDTKIRVSPKPRTRIGPFFGWRWAFLGYNFDLRSIFMNSTETDLGGSVYSAAFGLDLFYRRVGGNYNIKEVVIKGVDVSDYLRGMESEGLSIGMTRVSFYYVPNYRHYSHQAAFSQTNRQLRSAGSLLLGASYAHNRIIIDWEDISQMLESAGISYNGDDIFTSMKNDEFSLMGGFGYNWVFAKNWLAASEAQIHLGYLVHHNEVADTKEDNILKSIRNFYRKNIAFNSSLRLSLLYNNGPWFAGTQAVMHYYQYGNGNVVTRTLYGTAYLFVGFNF